MAAQSDWNAFDDAFYDSSDGIPFRFNLVNIIRHLLLGFLVYDTNGGFLSQTDQLVHRKLVGRRFDFADANDLACYFDSELS
ncbi:hypothetical protein D3C85_1657930 [compost metagenome]